MKKIIVALLGIAFLSSCAKEPEKCSDSREVILTEFTKVMNNNTQIIGLLHQSQWFENVELKSYGLQQSNLALKDSESTLKASTVEQLNKDCKPEVDLVSLKQSLNNMIEYTNSEINIIKQTNDSAEKIIKDSGCKDETSCTTALREFYNEKMVPVNEKFKNQLKSNKLSNKAS